ncbi:MAG: hypothetical protein P1V18_03445 [Candidatus Gracilibacteria bacterium]|nr:hypothetical protein [Candidatus Gracilibacteria bacterium]
MKKISLYSGIFISLSLVLSGCSSIGQPAKQLDLSNWTPYTSEKHNLSFSYPNDWRLVDDGLKRDLDAAGLTHFVLYPPVQNTAKGNVRKLEFMISNTAPDTTEDLLNSKEEFLKYKSLKTFLNNTWAYAVSTGPGAGTPYFSLVSNDMRYTAGAYYLEENKETYEKIMKTFEVSK